jgi:hypothetical protein
MFTLNEAHLNALFDANSFPIPDQEMVFIGIRGCLPEAPSQQAFQAQHDLSGAVLNYRNPRCTLIQWRPSRNDFAVYPGSTVPHIRLVQAAQRNNGVGANQLMTGLYTDYRKGTHKAGSPTGHRAFRQEAIRPILRTADDTIYEFDDDRVEITNPFDNLHAAWCQSIEGEYSSAGCQVVVGLPACSRRGNLPSVGPWKIFVQRAYDLDQDRFHYALIDCGYLKQIALATGVNVNRVRFGSQGDKAKLVQQALKDKGYYEGAVDGSFGPRSLRSLLDFQRDAFGREDADGICGPVTAESLGIDNF